MTLYYLHGFSSLSPSASDLEFCRLRLEPSSVVCVLEDKLHGKSLVLKVTGQEMIGSSNSEDHQSNILSPPRMVRRQSSKKLAQLSPSQSTSIGSRPQSSSHRASSCGEVESTWLFAMEGVSHLKAWMKVLKEVVNVLKQSASLADSTPVPSRQSISNNLNISHNDLTSPGKEPSFSSGSLKKKYSNIIPLPVSSEPQMVSRDLSIDPALNPVPIDPRLISFPSLNPLLPSLDSEVAPCTSVFPIANRTQRASSQVSYAPSSSSSASTDQLICSPQTDSDQSSPTMRRSNHDHSMLTDFPERPPSSVSQRRAKDLERLRMKDDRLVTIRGPICLDDEALSPTEVSSDFNFATKQSQFRSQQVLPSLPCPPRIRSARKPGAGQGLKKSCSITSSRKNSFLSDSEPPTSPLGQHTDLNSSSHYLELHRSVQGASPIGRTGSLKGLENGSVKGLDEEISNNEEATVSALSSGEQAIRNLKLKPRSVKLPPVLVEGNGAALRKRISSTNIIAVRSNLVRRELEADKFSPVDSKSSFHTAEDIENFSQFSASDFGLLPAPEIRQDNYTVPSTPPPLAKSNHKYRADNKSKDRDENENGPNIARSASDFATPLKSSISKSSVMTLSPSSSEFRIKIRNEEIGRSLRSGSLTGSLMSMNSSHTNLSISSQTPPPPKYPPPNISLPELPRE
ncbi:hypothetical protein BY996DRAFT_6410205 [Phakopsora pachyrhizi]|nr:hypothetical protein BY996DRAFT_6410205 [Phakopsora pachyrhizi]